MGKVAFVVGDDVSTDVIYPGRYMATVLPTETPQYAFANDPALNAKLNAKEVPPGSVLVGGKNFGCGSSREQAVSCLKGWELTIVASDVARRVVPRAPAPCARAAPGLTPGVGRSWPVRPGSGATGRRAPGPGPGPGCRGPAPPAGRPAGS